MFDKWKHRPADVETPLSVLAITNSTADRTQLERIFDRAGWRIVFAESIAAAAREPARVVVCDRDTVGPAWREALQELAGQNGRRCVILASSVADDYLWEEVLQLGGYDVLVKPYRESDVLRTIEFGWAAVTKSLPSVPHTR